MVALIFKRLWRRKGVPIESDAVKARPLSGIDNAVEPAEGISAQDELGLPISAYRPRRDRLRGLPLAIGLFVVALMLVGESIYILSRPEHATNYRILRLLQSLDPPQRFTKESAPTGEFLDASQLYDRYTRMTSSELSSTNAELARDYVRNFRGSQGRAPYVVGTYVVIKARELNGQDVISSGFVALTKSVDNDGLLMEHVFSSAGENTSMLKQTLQPKLEIRLEAGHDRSVVVHVERIDEKQISVTVVPLYYGTYTIAGGTDTFTLEPPTTLNLRAGWRMFKEQLQSPSAMR